MNESLRKDYEQIQEEASGISEITEIIKSIESKEKTFDKEQVQTLKILIYYLIKLRKENISFSKPKIKQGRVHIYPSQNNTKLGEIHLSQDSSKVIRMNPFDRFEDSFKAKGLGTGIYIHTALSATKKDKILKSDSYDKQSRDGQKMWQRFKELHLTDKSDSDRDSFIDLRFLDKNQIELLQKNISQLFAPTQNRVEALLNH